MDDKMLAIKTKLKEVVENYIPVIEESIKYYQNKPNSQKKIEKLQKLYQYLTNNYAMQVPQLSIKYLFRAEKVGRMLKDKYSISGAKNKGNNSAAGIATPKDISLAKIKARKSNNGNDTDISECSAVHKIRGNKTGRLFDGTLPCLKKMSLNTEIPLDDDTSPCPKQMSLNTETLLDDISPHPKMISLNTEIPLDNTSPYPKQMSLNTETPLADSSSCSKLIKLSTERPLADTSSCSKPMSLNPVTPLDTLQFQERMSLDNETPCPKLISLNTETPLDEVSIRPKLIASNAMEALLPEEWKKTPNFLIPQYFEVGPLRATLCSGAPLFSCRECFKYSALNISVLRLHFREIHKNYKWDGLCLICGNSKKPSERSHSLSAVLVHLLRHVLNDTASPLTAFWDNAFLEESQSVIEDNKIDYELAGRKESRKRSATVGDARKSVEEIMMEMYEDSSEEGIGSESVTPPKILRPVEVDIIDDETVQRVIRMLED